MRQSWRKTDDGYLRVRWLIRRDKQDSLPEWVGEKPQRQDVKLDENGFPDDDLPF